MLPLWFVALLACLATFRVTRLITRDELPLVAAPRDAFVRRWGTYSNAPKDKLRTSIGGQKTNIVMRSLAYLWECDWCTSAWVAAGVATGTYYWYAEWWWQVALLGATASAVTGLIAQREPD